MGDVGNDIAWSDLRHNYGAASDIPGLLKACADPDADTAADALGDLDNKLYHQGGWVCSAASAALPLLAELAHDRVVHYRNELVEMIWRLARTAVTVRAEHVDPGWAPALEATRPRLLALLDDQDERVRREAIVLAAQGIRHPDTVTALRRRWAVETDRVTRADLLLAFGAVCAWTPDDALRAEVRALLTDDDSQVRLAAVQALAEFDPGVAAGQVDTLVQGVLDPDALLWQDTAWIGGGPATIVQAAGDLLLDDPAAATAFAFGVARDERPLLRAAALVHAQEVLCEWRTATGGLVPLLAEGLGDDVPEVRYHAAALLACLGSEAAGQVGELVALTADSAPRDSRGRTTVGDAAVWALARQGHPGCLPGLVERLTGDRLGFDAMLGHYPRKSPSLGQPGFDDLLIPLRQHADVLIGPLAARPDQVRNLCRVAEAWGPDAAPAVPALVDAAAGERLRAPAALAIGAVGPAAAEAARTLAGDTDEPAVAWALWRTGADPDLGAARLIEHLAAARPRHTTIALAGDLGPVAAPCADALRALTHSADLWVRTEAARALWRVTGDPAEATTVLTEVAEPLALGDGQPARVTALRYLVDIGATGDRIRSTAHAVVGNPRRISFFGGWRVFTEDERIRAAASALLR